MKGSLLQVIILLSISLLCSSQLCSSQQRSQSTVYTDCLEFPSCQAILAKFPLTPSGYYQLATSTEEVYCDMETVHCGSKGWARIGQFNMSNPNHKCPGAYNLYESPIRSCGGLKGQGCAKVTYSSLGLQYSQVCGRVKGYQIGTTDAFGPYLFEEDISVLYMDGIVIKGAHSNQHIWAYAVGLERYPTTQNFTNICPCASKNFTGKVPPHIGKHYYCDSGADSEPTHGTFYTEPLWTGKGCTGNNLCCSRYGMPWFCRTLPMPTTDGVRVENCHNTQTKKEDVALELLEIYIR